MILKITAQINNGICGQCKSRQDIKELRENPQEYQFEDAEYEGCHPEPEFMIKIKIDNPSKSSLLHLVKLDLPLQSDSLSDRLKFIRSEKFIEIGPYEKYDLDKIVDGLQQQDINYEIY